MSWLGIFGLGIGCVKNKFEIFGGRHYVKYTITHSVTIVEEELLWWAQQIEKELNLFCKLCL